jgi:predicted RND superfamily exporter protein
MRIGDLVARIVTERRAYVWLGVVAGAIVCLIIFVSRISLDSEVLNMLPGKFSSVQGLKIYDRAFEQTRELTFALHCQPGDVDKLEEFAPIFAQHLRKQPWVERVLVGSPMQTPDGIRDLQSIAVPLLLNLDPPAFEEAISVLQPEKLRERFHRFREQIEAGSPRAQFQLEFDPLGLIGPALKPFAESNRIEEEQPLVSSDRTMRVFLVVTNQPSINAFECQRVMRQVNAFRAHAREGWEGGPLDVLVTGRSAYVAEISWSMQHDVIATVIGSVVLVGIIFFTGFGRWMPLLGMGFSLLLSCLVALAIGLLIFGRLNMVTVGFCAILVGLGVDFAILIFGRYQQARTDGESHPKAISTSIQKLGRSVFFGALTTAVGFLALILSGSIGFSQLGVLIAIGILFAGLFMCTILFLFVPEGRRSTDILSVRPAGILSAESAPAGGTPTVPTGRMPVPHHDWIFEAVKKYVAWSVRRPAAVLTVATVILAGLTLFGFSLKPPLPFDASARSLEPKKSQAGQALAAIMSNMPVRWEPVLVLVRAPDAQRLHDDWKKISTHWSELQATGKIKGFSTPAALAPSPMSIQSNREELRTIDFQSVRRTLEETLDAEGFSRDSFSSAYKLLDDLQSVADPNAPLPNWRDKLPKSSSWWFLVERYFAQDPLLTVGFVTSNEPIRTHAQYVTFSRDLPVPAVPMILSGWSYTLVNLLPWAQRQLLIVTGAMAVFEGLLLAVLYRDWRLWAIQEITLIFGIGAMLATMKLFNLPLNLLNVLAFRLVIAIGVDYGIYVLFAWQKAREVEHDIAGVVKPVLLAGLTALAGFGALVLAKNPSLSGLGVACAIGIFWNLVATIFFTLPAAAAVRPKGWRGDESG